MDLGAKNGSYVNGQAIEPLGKKRLQHGDILKFGNCKTSLKLISSKQEKAEKECEDSDGERVDQRKAYHFLPNGSAPISSEVPSYADQMRLEDRLLRSEQ